MPNNYCRYYINLKCNVITIIAERTNNNIDMENSNNELTLLNTRCWVDVVEGLKHTFKGWVKEVVEEVIDEKMVCANLEDKRLNTDELCQRWNISKATLIAREKDGIIAPLPLGGRRKIYSMKDVLNAESDGLVKIAC